MRPTITKQEIPRVRQWRGSPLSPVDEALLFHGRRFAESFRRLIKLLQDEGIEYVVIGELAAAAHRCSRATPNIDLCVREVGLACFRERLAGKVYDAVEGHASWFRDRLTQVIVRLHRSGDWAGYKGRSREIRFPDPGEAVAVEGLRTVSLERLIALKLVTWRRKDWADVIALIRENRLDEGFAQKLPGFLRMAYLQCYDEMREEDRYEKELDEEP